MVGESSRVKLEYVGGSRWRVSALCYSGKHAAVEGDLASVTRLAARADRLFAVWAKRNAVLSTAPPPGRIGRPRPVPRANPG